MGTCEKREDLRSRLSWWGWEGGAVSFPEDESPQADLWPQSYNLTTQIASDKDSTSLSLSVFRCKSEVKWSRSVVSDSLQPHGLPGFAIHGIFQARVLEWVAIAFSRGSSQPRDQIQVFCIAGRGFLPSEPPGKPRCKRVTLKMSIS